MILIHSIVQLHLYDGKALVPVLNLMTIFALMDNDDGVCDNFNGREPDHNKFVFQAQQ